MSVSIYVASTCVVRISLLRAISMPWLMTMDEPQRRTQLLCSHAVWQLMIHLMQCPQVAGRGGQRLCGTPEYMSPEVSSAPGT